MTTYRILSLATLASTLLTGCLFPVPPHYDQYSRENVEEKVPEFITSGVTTREDVMMALGEPDGVALDESWFVYGSAYCEGGMGLFMAAGGAAGVIATTAVQYRRLILQFDPHGIVTQPTFEALTCAQYWGGMSNSPLQESKPCLDIQGCDVPLKFNLPGKR